MSWVSTHAHMCTYVYATASWQDEHVRYQAARSEPAAGRPGQQREGLIVVTVELRRGRQYAIVGTCLSESGSPTVRWDEVFVRSHSVPKYTHPASIKSSNFIDRSITFMI